MDIKKYEQIPNEFATAKEIGLSAQTLSAFVRRGMAEVQQGSPNKYRKIENISIKVYNLLEKHKVDTYFGLYKKNQKLGMLCKISNGDIVDCWGKKYDLTDVITVRIKNEYYTL